MQIAERLRVEDIPSLKDLELFTGRGSFCKSGYEKKSGAKGKGYYFHINYIIVVSIYETKGRLGWYWYK